MNRRRMFGASVLMAAGLFAGAAAELLAQQQSKFITVGTGAVTGVYYSVGGAICQLVNQNRGRHRLRCSVEATTASVFNLQAVLQGDLDFGLAQSGLQYAFYEGQGAFSSTRSVKDLRSLFSLHDELVTLVVRKDAGIKEFEGLRRRRLNAGVVGSGTRIDALKLIRGMGMVESDFAALTAMKPDEQSDALCQNRIDAFVYVIGHPVQNIQDAINKCGATVIPIDGPKIDALLRTNPHYVRGSIPGSLYAQHPDSIRTYGVRATLMVSSKTPADVVYHVVKSVFDNFEEFVNLHPALSKLRPENMIREGLSAPLHEGAIKYYKERGWM